MNQSTPFTSDSAASAPGRRRPGSGRLGLIATLVRRLAWFTLLWWVLAEGRWDEPLMIAVLVAAGTGCSLLLWPTGVWRWRPLQVLAFLPWFLRQSLAGGFDVARRAFQPVPALQPRVVSMDIDLPPDASCLFAWIVSLLPGTACVHRESGQVKIHLLDETCLPQVRELEARIRRLLHPPAARE